MNINIVPNGAIKRVHVSQNDVGRTLTFELFNNSTSYTIPIGATVKIQGTKPSGFGFSETCTVSGNTVTVDTTETMTDEHGYIETELSISYNGNKIGTSNFYLVVEKNPHPDTTTDGSMETIIPELTLLVNEVKGYAEEIEGTYHAYGSPWVASTVSQMTDTDKIYVYTGSETGYTNGNWYYYNGSAWVSGGVYNAVAVNIDPTLTIQGACADAKAVGDEINAVKQDFNDLVYGVTHTYTVSNTGTNKFNALLLKGIKYTFTNNTNAQCTLRVYNSDGTNVLITSALATGSSITFIPSAYNAYQIGGWMSGTGTVTLATDFSAITDKRLLGIYDYSFMNSWQIGSIYGENGSDYDSNTRGIRTPINAKVWIDNNTVALSVNPLIETVYAFKYDSSNAYIGRLGVSGMRSVHLDSGYYYRFLALASAGTVITADTIVTYSANFWTCGDTLANLLIANDDYTTSVKGYSIGSDLVKRELLVERQGTGTLKYGQSFLIYNNKFYSTDGEHIAVQAEDFTLEQDVDLSVGHGNAFCLGVSNKGYISGWDDNRIYVVNLDDLTLHTTIELPTTGYTTCAIDEPNGIAYIFQRDTRPNTESRYHVIAYDYVGQTVLYTNETTKAFGAMQACDYFNDKIIVLNGLGTTAIPNGYRVYNTKGEILADYVIPAFENIEPEGVFFDRDTHTIYTSNVDGKIYKITE